MNRMKTVFLSGPYSTGFLTCNISRAIHAARFLRDKGYNVFCPHVAIAGYCDDWTEDKEHRKLILSMCAQWVEICEVFALIPGWQESDGCWFEYAIAEANDKPIIHLTYGQIGV